MEFTPPKTALNLWQLRTLAVACLLFLLLSFLGFSYSLSVFPLWGITAFIYLPFFFKEYRVCVSDDSIILNYGVIIKHKKAYKKSNIIYTSKILLPDAAAFDLCIVMLRGIRTRGFILELRSRDAAVFLPESCRE